MMVRGVALLLGLTTCGGCTCRGEVRQEIAISAEPGTPAKKTTKTSVDARPPYPTPSDDPFDNVAPDDGKFPFALVPRDPPASPKPAKVSPHYLMPKVWDPATFTPKPEDADSYREQTVTTPVGVEIHAYQFVGASDSAFGLELKRGGARALLLRDIAWWALSPSKKRFYMRRDGLSIVDLEALSVTDLPGLPCTREAQWGEERLITHSMPPQIVTPTPTHFCIFSASGTLLGRLVGHDLPWMAASEFDLPLTLGFLRSDPEIFFALDRRGPSVLYLLDLRDPKRRFTYRVSSDVGWRADVDLSDFTLDQPTLRFRDGDEKPPPPWASSTVELIAP